MMDKEGQEEREEVKGYQYIETRFGKEKIASRSEWLYNLMEDYLIVRDLVDKVSISRNVLKHVLVDYFVDIERLKDFAQIPRANDSKIYAYTCFWLLRHKPLQIKSEYDDQSLVFVNEEFVAHLLRSYLLSEPNDVPILNNKREEVDNFSTTLLYYFKYREYSAKNIEMIILAFKAGRGYQYSVDYQQK